ncbi:MAG: cytochrome c biogenesis protein CcsA [Fimbriimonadales bacterium]|nr:cytochrome c biogenesis protein CcsA [Fimbriimonadales bacterium]
METNLMELLPSPPAWSLTLGRLGASLVVAAAALFLASSLAGGAFGSRAWGRRLGAWAFGLGGACLLATFLVLATLFANNRFEWEYVWSHADSRNTLPYRIAGIWSGQQGSFLLWGVCMALFGALAAPFVGPYRRGFLAVYSLPLAAIAAILAYETPFHLIREAGRVVVPTDGVGLSPALQNYWVTIHPPVIFLGFGALTVPFALAAAAMLHRDLHGWVPLVRPWAVLSTTLLGLGLCMGGFWAYETLGWGGFWMWDPVENTSFVPWALGAALIHGLMVQRAKGRWVATNLLLGAAPFLAFAYGTFLTRSGMLSDVSVHSFAEMDRAALKLLVGLCAFAAVGFLGLWLWTLPRAIAQRSNADPEPPGWDRETLLRAGTYLLVLFAGATLVGMSLPFFMAIAGRPAKVVEERLYHQTLSFLFVPLMVVMAAAPFVGWRKLGVREVLRRVYNAFCLSFGLVGLSLLAMAATPIRQRIPLSGELEALGGVRFPALPWLLVLLGLCWFVLVANLWRAVELGLARKLASASFWSHVGLAMLLGGLIFSRGFERKGVTNVQEGRPGAALGYTFEYVGQTSDRHDRDNRLIFRVTSDDGPFEARPGLYYVVSPQDGRESPMVWPHIQRFPLHDVYIVPQPEQSDASGVVSLKPGESFEVGRYRFTFERLERKGQPGAAGTEFLAVVKASSPTATFEVRPGMRIVQDGVEPIAAPVGHALQMRMNGMNVGDGSVNLQVSFNSPLYPIEVYYKPLTILVWLGTGVLTLAGLAAAWNARPRLRSAA